MIRDSKKGLFDIVLVRKIDRFFRDRYDSVYYKHLLKKNEIKVVSAKENISDGSEGIILEFRLFTCDILYKFLNIAKRLIKLQLIMGHSDITMMPLN